MLNNSLYMSNKDDWETPKKFFDELNSEFNFTLDPCCTELTAKCEKYYTPVEDGLKQNWYGNVFMNPPYGRVIINWVDKAYNECLENNAKVVCLLPARTDTRWWHEYCMKSSEIRLCTRRLTFEGANNKATFPAAIVIFNKETLGLRVLNSQVI